MKKRFIFILLLVICITKVEAQVEPLLLYKVTNDESCQSWVDQTMAGMTLKDKVGQLFIYTLTPRNTRANQQELKELIRQHKMGGLLFSGGSLLEQAALTNLAQNNTQIPLMITFDGEWGLAMRLKSTPSFPRNMVLGCIQDEQLIYEYGKEVARQLREIGVHVNFAPVADVNINPDNPVINTRSFGEDPVDVANKVLAYSAGLESEGVLSVSKHFPGHGDTDVDSHEALPQLPFSRARLDSVELYPFRQAIRAGVSGMMVGHLQVPELDSSLLPASLSKSITTDLLKNELGFKGMVFTDALAMQGVATYKPLCTLALQAGADMVLTPPGIKNEIEQVMEALKKGTLTEEMIDEKCRKVLTYKYALGLNAKPHIDLEGVENRVSTAKADSLINRLRLAAVTVLHNHDQTLPIHPAQKELAVLSIGGNPNSDKTFIRELNTHSKLTHIYFPNGQSVSEQEKLKQTLAAFKNVIVSVSSPDASGYNELLTSLADSSKVIYSLFIPLTAAQKYAPALSVASACVLAHSREVSLQRYMANVLFGKAVADGRLSAAIPGVYKVGQGVTITPEMPPRYEPEEVGLCADTLALIDTLVANAIAKKVFPGCQVYVMKDGKTVYDRSFGTFTYEAGSQPVRTTDLYDLASLSKTTGTLLAFMKLYDRGLVNLTDCVGDHLSFLKGTDKADITLSELLYHQSGLPPSISFYKEAIDEHSYQKSFVVSRRDASHAVQVGKRSFASTRFRYKAGLTSTTPSDTFNVHVADKFWLNRSFADTRFRLLAEAPLRAKVYRYSCVNFMLLKEIVEQLSGQSLDAFLEREFYEPMGLKRIVYLPLRYFGKEQIAPSVRNDYLRKHSRVLQGFVHDEAAAFFGGVSGNAGLFATADNVAAVHQMWLDEGVYRGKRYLSEETCRLFTTPVSTISRRGLGFDKPDMEHADKSPCAELAPASVYGHTGFTGTCAWVDPDNGLVFVFLCNRTFPEPWNAKLMEYQIRPALQEIVYKALKQDVAYSK